MSLTATQAERYRRHLLLREVGAQGQQLLLGAAVLVVGAGGLGCPALPLLVGAGVGRVTICDGDVVETSNLHRQTLYRPGDEGRAKAEVAAERLAGLNPDVAVGTVTAYLTQANADDLVAGHTLVLEGLDRFAPRYVLNAACLRASVPLVTAAAQRFSGQAALLTPGVGPCYACLVPEAPDDEVACEREGVLGSTTGVIGAYAAGLALMHLAGRDVAGRLSIWEGLAGTMRTVRLPRDPGCPVCGV